MDRNGSVLFTTSPSSTEESDDATSSSGSASLPNFRPVIAFSPAANLNGKLLDFVINSDPSSSSPPLPSSRGSICPQETPPPTFFVVVGDVHLYEFSFLCVTFTN